MKQLNIIFFIILFSLANYGGYSTHNKAGEITYRKISGTTYEITITTYTDPRSSAADRCELPISWGDGRTDTLQRTNGNFGNNCNHAGVVISPKVQLNEYVGRHTYSGNGRYEISMEDPNRIEGIHNIPNSVGIPFFIKTTLFIHPNLGSNSSPKLTFPPLDEACLCKGFYHNPGALDPDGDSLSYSLSVCYGADGKEIPGYSLPIAGCGKKIFNLNERTGTLTWDAPSLSGTYNVCILIVEWRKRKYVTGPPIWDTVGTVLRDMQIEVATCNNNPPEFLPLLDQCVIAGDTINQVITAYDKDINNRITLTGQGEPLSLINSPAVFRQPVTALDTVKSTFSWATQCSHVKLGDYITTFKAKDDDSPISLANFTSFKVKVIGPKVENMQISRGKNAMLISWDPSFCLNIVGYDVYRKIDSSFWNPTQCQTGIPAIVGFKYIGSTTGHSTTSFKDDNFGIGLFHGVTYCYRVVAKFSDGSESISSKEVCDELVFNTPIMTRNSVHVTDKLAGSDSIAFAKPTVVDFSLYQPPYSFKIFSVEGSTSTIIYSSPSYNSWSTIDTVLLIKDRNTSTIQNSYKVELISEKDQIGESRIASSTFLKIFPDDRRLHLSWQQNVQWSNFEYVIFKEINGVFEAIDTVANQSYIDSNLVNLQEYRYFVKGRGKFSISELPDTLINNSQIAVGIPKDTIPPCPPGKPSIKSECELYRNKVSWKNPNDSCFYKDAVRYKLYFTPFVGGDYVVIKEFSDINDTTVLFEELESVAGCYGVTAIDTFDNESELSVRVCVDNCPLYELPNVFTPGGDGYNDLFHPIYPYRYVKDIDMTILNRWGQIMFKTTDPDILWDGKRMDTQKQVVSGVYFFVCTVNEIRLSGIIPRELKGQITVINEIDGSPKE